jgi:FdrA protein
MPDAVRVFEDTYVDSVLQLSATRAMSQNDAVQWAAAAMATEANLATLAEQGFDLSSVEASSPAANDLFLAVRASSSEAAQSALAAGEEAALSARLSPSLSLSLSQGGTRLRSLDEACSRGLNANVAVISVPGPYAAIEAHKALSAGMHVLLFSDNVALDEEIELKTRAAALDRLVMGPGAGTAMFGGTGLGFANAVKPGRVAVAAAAGTGAQEAMSLLDRWGAGVSQVIGLGGRDLTADVGGRMALQALAALGEDPSTDAILLVSKPPDAAVARRVLASCPGKPLIAALIGLDQTEPVSEGVQVAATLEEGVVLALASVGLPAPDVVSSLASPVAAACGRLPASRRLVRGLFSGGTLCYEALSILGRLLGPVYSNTPIDKRWALPTPPGSHQCLDLGEEEYTRGRPHPMIDPEARMELIRLQAADPDVAVILVDVVLGYGSHPDPASLMAPLFESIIASGPGGSGPAVVAYVLGTEQDPQGFTTQRTLLQEVGCITPDTAARAALAAAAIAARQPALIEAR